MQNLNAHANNLAHDVRSRLALGTAQFGLEYGVANRSGRVGRDEIMRILALAAEAGVDTLDTAIAYGESETALGEAGMEGWNIVTKLPAVPEGVGDLLSWVEEQVDASLRRLRVRSLHGLLLHQPEQLLARNGDRLIAALEAVKKSGRTRKIGVSIYDPQQLDELLARMNVDLVQAPLNILDRRLVESGWGERLNQAGVEVHARSAFLQGLLLMTERPGKFRRWDALWAEWDGWLRQTGLTPLEACLRYALSQRSLDKVIVGVDGVGQLQQILSVSMGEMPPAPSWSTPVSAELIDPSCWSNL